MMVRLSDVVERAKARPPGYYEDVVDKGRVDGEWLELDDEVWTGLYRKYRGLGDVVAAVAKPVAKAVDAVFGTGLSDCGGCTGRQEALNAAVPFGEKER